MIKHPSKLTQATKLISKYPQDVIDYMNEFRESAANLYSYGFDANGNMIEIDNSDDVAQLRHSYLYGMLYEGGVDTEEEFYELLDALDLVYPIQPE